jgi:aarF domain-containing kinase
MVRVQALRPLVTTSDQTLAQCFCDWTIGRQVFVDPKKKKFVLFDVGIVAAYTEADHTNLVDVLAAFIRRQGRLAGRLMIDSSNRLLRDSNDHAIDEELFIDKIEAMNKKATTKDYLMENLGKYITTICNAASQHHVLVNQAFISAALAVKIQEGIALALDPSIKIYKVAIPVIYESERRRGVDKAKKKANQLFGFDNFFDRKSETA